MNLDAWEPPDPPDVADAVIARMHASTPHADEAPRRRLWWLAVPAPAAAAALVTFLASRGDDSPSDGTITADRARHVELAGASADLEPNTTIRWHHDKTGLRVEQTGAATWKTDDHLRIAAGATSIDATAANLRVETQMNRQDAATVATSAITAAAVALVTVTVYNGTVRAGAAPIAPGTTVAFAPTPAPAPAPPPLNAHQAALDACNDASNRHAWSQLPACAAELARLGDRDTATLFIQRGEFEAANEKIFAEYEQAYAAHDGNKVRALIARMPASSVYAGQMVPLASCDVDDLKRRGEAALANGNYAEAERIFTGAYNCRPEPQSALRGYLASCKAANATLASTWFHRLLDEQQASVPVIQICLSQGIDPRGAVTGTATYNVSTTPTGAEIILDGSEVGLHTPAMLNIPPGKHRITLVVGDDKYTFSVNAVAGQTVDFAKKLQ